MLYLDIRFLETVRFSLARFYFDDQMLPFLNINSDSFYINTCYKCL